MSEIKKGISFSELVKKYSDDFVTKDSGGDLEYFDSDVFPVEFSDALSDLAVNEISDVVELDETLHILKVTEFNQAKALTFEEKKVDILDELIEAESLAIMKDNFDAIDQMIASGDSIESIATKLSKEIIESNNLDNRNFMFEITDPIVKDFIFSSDAQIDVPTIIELQDSVIILSLSDILEPQLKTFEDVREEASSYLSESKAIEKKLLLSSEILLAQENGSLETFISAYDFISQDSFVGVKRYSSLLPQEVISELFLANEGNSISVDSRSGDKYIVDILKLNRPSKESVEELYTQYRDFSEDRLSETISSMINDDVFSSARINLGDISF
jgi:peptidyl-prolyl cis-trans isomerase D